MSAEIVPISDKNSSLSVVKIIEKIRMECENIIHFCTQEHEGITFLQFEKELWKLLSYMGILYIQLFLMSSHERLNYSQWLNMGLYYVRKGPVSKTVKTVFGKVSYCRTYLVRKDSIKKGGFYPLDMMLGLTADGFSPSIISQATRLATRVSFLTSVKIFGYFYDRSPSTESVEKSVSGLGREAGGYMEVAVAPEGDGEVLIIEADGKATPTATDEESESEEEKEERIKRVAASDIAAGKKGREKSGDDAGRVIKVRMGGVLPSLSCTLSGEDLTGCSMGLSIKLCRPLMLLDG